MISIVITTYNKLTYLRATLAYLEHQRNKNCFEVILIVDGSNDGTLEYLQKASFSYKFRYKGISQSGLANARNEGIELAQGDHVLFMDDDLLLMPDYLETFQVSLKEHPDHIHTGNLSKIHIDAVPDIFERVHKHELLPYEYFQEKVYLDPIYEPLKIVHKDSAIKGISCWWGIISGGNLCFPRSSFETIGTFDTNFTSWGPEDVDICYRAKAAGYDLKFNEDCVLYHLDHSRDAQGIAASMLKNAVMLYKKYKKPKELLAYLNYFNGTIGLRDFNAICSEACGSDNPDIDDYVLDLRDYINTSQLIKWKNNGLNRKVQSELS